MMQFNFNLQRFAANINSYRVTSDNLTRLVIPYNNSTGFGLIRKSRIYFSGLNHYNRFGFGWNDRDTDRNLMYRLKMPKTEKGKEDGVASACMDRNSAMILGTSGKLYVCGYNYHGKLGGKLQLSKTIREITEIPSPNKYVNFLYRGQDFTLATTSMNGYVYGTGHRKFWNPGASGGNADDFEQMKYKNGTVVQNVCKVSFAKNTTFLLTVSGQVKVYSSNKAIIRDKELVKSTKLDYVNYLDNVVDIDSAKCRAVFVTNNNKVYATGNFGCFNPWTGETKDFAGPLAECTIFKNIEVVKARIYGQGIIVLDRKGKVYAVGSNEDGRLDPDNSSEVIREPVQLIRGYLEKKDSGKYVHVPRDIACFYNTPAQGQGTIFVLCGCACARAWVYGLGYGSEFGRDTFITDPDYLNAEESYTYNTNTKIYGADNVVLIAKPTGVYAAGYNYLGELGTGSYESMQNVFTKVFDEQVDDISIGRTCCLIRTHGCVFGSGQIDGNAINTTEFKCINIGGKTDKVLDIATPSFGSNGNHTVAIIMKESGIYAAGKNYYRLIDSTKTKSKNIETFTKISLYKDLTPAKFFNTFRKGGLMYKLPSNAGPNIANATVCLGVKELYGGIRINEIEGDTAGNDVETHTIGFDGANIKQVAHYKGGALTETTVVTFERDSTRVRVYTRTCRNVGIPGGSSHIAQNSKNNTKNSYAVIDLSIGSEQIEVAYPGEGFIAILSKSGNVYVCGHNSLVKAKYVRDKYLSTQKRITQIADVTNIEDIRVVRSGIVMLRNDGKVILYGYFSNGTGGTGQKESYIDKQEPIAYLDRKYKDHMIIEAGRHMSFFGVTDPEQTNTTVYAIGHTHSGGLGNGLDIEKDNTATGTVSYRSLNTGNAIIQTPDEGVIKNIVASNYDDHRTYIIYENGRVYATGNNQFGQLGVGDTNNRSIFTRVTFPAAEESDDEVQIVKVAVGNKHTLFLDSDGTVYGCGKSSSGELGNNLTAETIIMTPVVIAGRSETNFHNTETLVDLDEEIITDIAAGDKFSILLNSEGEIYMAGNNTNGAFGDGSAVGVKYYNFTINKKVRQARAIFASSDNTFYESNKFDLYGAGYNKFKQLGGYSEDRANNQLTYVKIATSDVKSHYFESLELGNEHGGYIPRGKSPYMFGRNNHYQLGSDTSSAFQTRLTGVDNAIKIRCAFDHTLVLSSNGLVYSFGNNTFKQLGRRVTKEDKKYDLGYVFCVFPYVVAHVENDSGEFTATNGRTYYYKFMFILKKYDETSCTYSVGIVAGCDIDPDTNDVDYCIEKTSSKEYQFTRYTVNTIEDTLYEAARALLGDANNPADGTLRKDLMDVVYDIEDIDDLEFSYFRDGLGTYYAKVHAEFGEFEAHKSKSVTVTISTTYHEENSNNTVDFSSDTEHFPDDIPTTITIHGGSTCKADIGKISIVMGQHKKAFIDYIKNIPIPLDKAKGEAITIDNSKYRDATLTNKNGLTFQYTITGECDTNGQKGYTKTAITTTMTISLDSLKCTTNRVEYPSPFTFTDELTTMKDESVKDRTFVITYATKKDAQTNFETHARSIANKLSNYLAYWSYPPYLPDSWYTYEYYVSNGNTFKFTKFASCENSVISYGVKCAMTSCEPRGDKYVKKRTLDISGSKAKFTDTVKTSTNLAIINNVDVLSNYHTSHTYTYSGTKFTTYIDSINESFASDITALKKSLSDKVGLMYEPDPNTVELGYKAPNNFNYTIKCTLDMGNFTTLDFAKNRKNQHVGLFVETKDPINKNNWLAQAAYYFNIEGEDKKKLVSEKTLTRGYSRDYKCSFKYHEEVILGCLDELIQYCKNNLANVIGEIKTTEITGSEYTFLKGVYYYRAYLTLATRGSYKPHVSTSVKFNVHLKYGRSKNKYTTDFTDKLTTKNFTIRGGSNFTQDLKQIDKYLKAAVKNFTDTIQDETIKAIPTETEKTPYQHKIGTEVVASYYIRSRYTLKKDTEGKCYVCYIATEYGLGPKEKDFKYEYGFGHVVINKDNYTNYPNNVKTRAKEIRDSLKNRLKSFLGSNLTNRNPNAYRSDIGSFITITSSKEKFGYPTMKVYCENTSMTYNLKFVKSLTYNRTTPEISSSLKTKLTAYWKFSSDPDQSKYWNEYGSESIYTYASTYSTYVTRLNNIATNLIIGIDSVVRNFLGTITLPSVDTKSVTAKTGVLYYLRHKFDISKNKANTKATITISEEWDVNKNFTNNFSAWSTTASHPIDSSNFKTHKADIKKKADSLRASCKTKWLDCLVPPIEDSDTFDENNNVTIKGTGITYSYWLTFVVETNTDYTYNGVASIRYDIEWKDSSSDMERRTYDSKRDGITNGNFKNYKTKAIPTFRSNTVKALTAYLTTLVPPLEKQGTKEETYISPITGFSYDLTTTFNIKQNTDYTANGIIKVDVKTTWASGLDGYTNNVSYSAKDIKIDKTNYYDRDNIIRDNSTCIRSMKAYLDSVLPPIEDTLTSFTESGFSYRASNTNELYFIKTTYNLNGKNSNYTQNGKVLFYIQTYWGTSSKNIETLYESATHYIKPGNYITRFTDLPAIGEQSRNKLKTYLDDVLPPVTSLDISSPEYGSYTASTTHYTYYLKTTYKLSKKVNEYTKGGIAKVKITVQWNTDGGEKYDREWSSIEFDIKPSNYFNYKQNVLAEAEKIRNSLGEHLNTLVPPITELSDRESSYVAATEVDYYNLIDFKIDTKTNFDKNGKGVVSITPKWGRVDNGKYDHTVKDLTKTFPVTTSTYYGHAEKIKALMKEVEDDLKKLQDQLLGPIDTIPDYESNYKINPVNGIMFKNVIKFVGTYSKYAKNGTFTITLKAYWTASQKPTVPDEHADVEFVVPKEYSEFTVTVANYANHVSLVEAKARELDKYMDTYLNTLIGKIIAPNPKLINDYISPDSQIHYFLKTTWIVDPYTAYGVYNDLYDTEKSVRVEVKTICGETKTEYELGEYVDLTDPDDADFWYDKEIRIYNAIFEDHTERLIKLGEIQRRQICNKLDLRIGTVILPGEYISAYESEEVVPEYEASTTGLKYNMKTRYSILYDEEDTYDDIRIETLWSKPTDELNINGEVAYDRAYPDHLEPNDPFTYTIYRITVKNYVKHTERLKDVGSLQRHNTNKSTPGLREYLETLIGIVVRKHATAGVYVSAVSHRVIDNNLLDSCIVIPDTRSWTYKTKSKKNFYLETEYSYGGNATGEDEDETECPIRYQSRYSPKEDFSSRVTNHPSRLHIVTANNFKTRDQDMLDCSNNDFAEILPEFGIWDVQVPSVEEIIYLNRGGVAYYIKTIYKQGPTTDDDNTIKFKIMFSREAKITNTTSMVFGPCEFLPGQQGYYIKKKNGEDYTILDQESREVTSLVEPITEFEAYYNYVIDGGNFIDTVSTAQAIVDEAARCRQALTDYLYVPTVYPKETEEFLYSVNNFEYNLFVEFNNVPDDPEVSVARNVIYVRTYIDGYQYGETETHTYTRTREEAEADMEVIYEAKLKSLKSLCNHSPNTQSHTIQRYNYYFEIVGEFSKQAGNPQVTITTYVDGIPFYYGAQPAQYKDVKATVDKTFLTQLDDCVQCVSVYALALRELVEDLPYDYSDTFTHAIETQNYSAFYVSYNKTAGNPNYEYTVKCDNLLVTDYDHVEEMIFPAEGINFQVYNPTEVVVTNTLNAITAMKSVLQAVHRYYETVITNKDGLKFGYRYEITKDAMANVARVSEYVDEVLFREYLFPYGYDSLESDRRIIYIYIENDIRRIKSSTCCYVEDEEDDSTGFGYYDPYEDDEITNEPAEAGETTLPPIEIPEGEVTEVVTGDPDSETGAVEMRLFMVSGILANHNDTGFDYSYDISYVKDPNDQMIRMTFRLDDEIYQTYSAKVEVDHYSKNISDVNTIAEGYFDDLVSMLNHNPSDTDTTPYNVNGFDYTCGAKFTKEAGSKNVIISILVDGIIEDTMTGLIKSHYGEMNTTSGITPTPLDDINAIISASEQAIVAKIATFKGLTKDVVVYNKNGFSFNLSTVYTKSLEDHTITLESFIDDHSYGPVITEELTEITRQLIDDDEHSSHTYHGRGLAAIDNIKTILSDVPPDIYYNNFNVNGFNYNLAVKYSKAKATDDVFVIKQLDGATLGDHSTLTFSVDSIDDIRVFGENLLDDLKQYLRDYTPANREYSYVPSDSELPFVIRTIYRKEVNNNNVYITTSLDGVTYGATTIKTFNINNINDLLDDVLVKEGLLKQQLEKTPRNYNEEYVVKNCVFKLDIKYEKAQDNLNVTTSVYLDDVRYGDARVERYDVTNPKSISEYPNQIVAQLKSLLSDTIPEDIISTYSRGKYTFDMEILFSKSSGSDVITITYRVDSADVYSTSLSTGSIIGV